MASSGHPQAPLQGLTLSLRLGCPPQSSMGSEQVIPSLGSCGPVVTAPIDPPLMGACHEGPAPCAPGQQGMLLPSCSEPLTRAAQVSELETPLKGPLTVSTALLSKYATNVHSSTSYVYLHVHIHTHKGKMLCQP